MDATPPIDTVSAAPKRQALPLGVWVLMGVCLLGLGLHIWRYDFLCDDAFISFRYARNFAQGHGLVFNPGYERVEGYSNFLWVLILAGAQRVGIPPEQAANPLLILFGFAIVALVVRFCRRELPEGASPYWIVAPVAVLAANRSFAMWCTSGLETKLYELLVVAAVFSTIREMDAMAAGRRGAFPWSALWLALAAMTRPDGILYAACIVIARAAYQVGHKSFAWRPLLMGAVAFVVPVGGQYVFRRIYYDDWFPNTYYAKVGGQTWWLMGGKYLAAFCLEYALVLWLPIAIAAYVAIDRLKRLHVPLIVAAAIVPHALYVASIGGDHFEWRVLDTYLPLLSIGFFYAGCVFGRSVPKQIAAAAYALVTIAAGMFIPEITHRQFPAEYRVGFPGLTPRDGYITEMIDSTQSPWVFHTPILGSYAIAYNDLVYSTTRQFVGLRQEEHRGFFATAEKQGKWIADLIHQGVLPADIYLATDCVGAIPYFSNLRVLDRVGLTDRAVARQKNAIKDYRVMAHDKMAPDDYIKDRAVDIAALDNVHIVLPAGHPRLLLNGHRAEIKQNNQVYANLGNGRFLLVRAVQGMDNLQRRLPRLKLEPASKLVKLMLGERGEAFRPVPRDKQFGPPYDTEYFDQGLDLYINGYQEATFLHWVCAVRTNPTNPMAIKNVSELAQWIEHRRATSQPVNFLPPPGSVTAPGEAPAPPKQLGLPSAAQDVRPGDD